jgi:hypothetical protein
MPTPNSMGGCACRWRWWFSVASVLQASSAASMAALQAVWWLVFSSIGNTISIASPMNLSISPPRALTAAETNSK